MRNRGKKETTRLFKQLHYVAIRIATGEEFKPVPFRKVTKAGYPLLLKPLIPLLQGNTWEKRMGLTLSGIYTLSVLAPNMDTSTITTPGLSVPESFMTKFRDFVSSNVERQEIPLGVPDFTFGARSGPNGPSVATAHFDGQALKSKPELLKAVREMMSITESPLRLSLEGIIHNLPAEPKYSVGRLAFLPEKGGKTRIIAILDFWTQQALKPIHHQLLKLLSSIEMDNTMDQDKGFKRALNLSKGKPVYSFDLSSATDRFPIELQLVVMTQLYGQKVSDLWKTLMNRGFNVKGTDSTITWARGQPLGAYSSWVVFALTHHLVVQWCAYDTGQRPDQYALLGDDVIIWNKKVAERYRSLLEELDIPVSFEKSIMSTGGNSTGEFTKRIFTKGVEISPLPLTALLQGLSTLLEVPHLYELLSTRWKLPRSLLDLYAFEHLPFKRGSGLLQILNGFHSVVRGITAAPWCGLSESSSALLQGLEGLLLERAISSAPAWKDVRLNERLNQSWGIVVPDSLLIFSSEADFDPHPLKLAEGSYRRSQTGRGMEGFNLLQSMSGLRRRPDFAMSVLIDDMRNKQRRKQAGKIVFKLFYQYVEKRIRQNKSKADQITNPGG